MAKRTIEYIAMESELAQLGARTADDFVDFVKRISVALSRAFPDCDVAFKVANSGKVGLMNPSQFTKDELARMAQVFDATQMVEPFEVISTETWIREEGRSLADEEEGDGESAALPSQVRRYEGGRAVAIWPNAVEEEFESIDDVYEHFGFRPPEA